MATASTVLAHFDNGEELAHYGVKGMKWGVRRSQKELDRLAGRVSKKRNKYERGLVKRTRDKAHKTHETAYKAGKARQKSRQTPVKYAKALALTHLYNSSGKQVVDLAKTVQEVRKERKKGDLDIFNALKEEGSDVTLKEVRKINNKDVAFRIRQAKYAGMGVKYDQISRRNERYGRIYKRDTKKVKHFDDSPALSHYGIKGMKWGVRRSQKELDRLAGRTPRSVKRQNRKKQRHAVKTSAHKRKVEKGLNKAERLEKKAAISRMKKNRKLQKALGNTKGEFEQVRTTNHYNKSAQLRSDINGRGNPNVPKNRLDARLLRQQRVTDLANIKEYKRYLRNERKKPGDLRTPSNSNQGNQNSQGSKKKNDNKPSGKVAGFVKTEASKAVKDAVKGTINRNVKEVYKEVAGKNINKNVDEILKKYVKRKKKG